MFLLTEVRTIVLGVHGDLVPVLQWIPRPEMLKFLPENGTILTEELHTSHEL
jgi:hypothetical protein